MIVDIKDSPSDGQQIVTIECALCCAVKGEDYKRFSYHLLHKHGPEDLVIEAPLIADGWGPEEEVEG